MARVILGIVCILAALIAIIYAISVIRQRDILRASEGDKDD